MPQSYAALYNHFVFSTKDWGAFITPAIAPRLYDYLGGQCRTRESPLLACGGTAERNIIGR